MGRLQDRVAVVTGGADGIGRGIVRRFASEGASVLVADIAGGGAEAVAREVTAEFGADALAVRVDVRDKEAILSMVATALARWPTIDILVNNAWGGGRIGRVENKTDAQMANGLSVGLYGPFWAMQAVFPAMRAQGRGNIINLCSLNGVNAHMGTLEYNCAKEALRTLTRTAAREWAPYGIVANAICPGAKTAAFRRIVQANPELGASADASNPMGRVGDPEADIAPVAAFLASDDARYVTGNTLFVDGGTHINGANWVPQLPEDS